MSVSSVQVPGCAPFTSTGGVRGVTTSAQPLRWPFVVEWLPLVTSGARMSVSAGNDKSTRSTPLLQDWGLVSDATLAGWLIAEMST